MMHEDIWEYVRAAIDNNNYQLTQMMLDFVCDDCPRALADCHWEATLGPLIACFPDLFFSLLRKLQHGGSAEDAMGFARSLPGLRTTASSTEQQAMILIYDQLGEGLHEVGYAVNRAFWEHTDQAVLCDMARFPTFKRFVGAMSRCIAAPSGDGSSGSSGLAMGTVQQTISDLLAPSSGKSMHAHVQGMEEPPGGEGSSGSSSSGSSSNNMVLGVGRMLAAALASRVDHVDAVVEAIVTWVELNAMSGVQVFVGGISKGLLCRLVESAPAPAIRLLSLVGPSAWDRLKIMQVPSCLLQGGNHLVMSTHMRNSCVWRSPELAHLAEMGYSEVVVDMLIDFGVPFECIYKAAADLATRPECFAVLVGTGLTGTDMKLLISNSISLTRVADFINTCSAPLDLGSQHCWRVVPVVSLLQEMLRERLSFRIVEAILDAGEMNEATLDANFRPGNPLFNAYPLPLYQPVYTAHFVQLLLTNWRKGARDFRGNVTLEPWDKRFIDTVLAANDPLSLTLKSAYDNKLKDTAVYLPPQANDTSGQLEQQRKLLLGGFVGNPLLLHRWPIFLLARLSLAAYQGGNVVLQWADRLCNGAAVQSPKPAQGANAVDAASLTLPWWAAADVGDGNILSALVSADAPSSFFGLVLVRAVFKLQWDVLGKPLVLLSAAVHMQLAACWLTFYLLVLDARQSWQGGDSEPLRLQDGPAVMLAMLYVSVALSSSMALELATELRRGRMGLRWNWVTFGRWIELCSHALVWSCAGLVRHGGPQQADTVAALAGLATLLLSLRMLLFALATERLCQVVLALLEIVSESRYFFAMLGIVYGAFALALAGLRRPQSDGGSGSSALALATKLFSMIAGDVSSDDLRDGSESGLSWTFTGLAATLLALYAVAMLIVFINLLIATMNDTYDRVKEFQEVEVMRLRSHMLEGLRLHVSSHVLAAFQGNCVHVLLRHGNTAAQWLARSSGSDIADQEAWTAWTGRIRYMRETIVRGVDERLQPVLAKVQAAAAAASSGDRGGTTGAGPTLKDVQ